MMNGEVISILAVVVTSTITLFYKMGKVEAKVDNHNGKIKQLFEFMKRCNK